jgi:hypothetical protein
MRNVIFQRLEQINIQPFNQNQQKTVFKYTYLGTEDADQHNRHYAPHATCFRLTVSKFLCK